MRKHCFLLFIFSLLSILALSSCNPMILNKTGKATISIDNSSIYSEEKNKSTTGVSIEKYTITATGPFGTKINKTIDANEIASFDSMVVGNWKIKVKAKNKDNVVIGEGSTNVLIEEDKENLINIEVKEKEGQGKLVVSIKYNSSTLTEIKITPKKSSGNTSTENLIKNKGNGNIYYSTAIDIDNGIYRVDVIENNNVKYSDDIGIIDGAITYFYGDLGDNAETTKIKNKLGRTPVIMFQNDEITVALNGTLNQLAYNFHLDLTPKYNIFYEWSYKGNVLAYSQSTPLCWDLEASKIKPEKGENILTFSIKIGNINESKEIAKKDFYFEVTDAVTDNSLYDAINALPNKYDLGNLSSYNLHRISTCQLKNANVLLPDNTLATLNTKENEEVELTTHKSIQDKKITNDYNLIRGSVEITHNNKTNYYVIDKNDFYSYISFETEHSNERVNVTNIKGKNILKDGVDISDNKAELEKLASYFVALLNDDNKTGITYLDESTDYNKSTSTFLFENYESGSYSINGSVEVNKSSSNINEDPCNVCVKPNLTLNRDNNKIVLSFKATYSISSKQYSNLEIRFFTINGREFSYDKLSESSIEKIKSFVGFLIQ